MASEERTGVDGISLLAIRKIPEEVKCRIEAEMILNFALCTRTEVFAILPIFLIEHLI